MRCVLLVASLVLVLSVLVTNVDALKCLKGYNENVKSVPCISPDYVDYACMTHTQTNAPDGPLITRDCSVCIQTARDGLVITCCDHRDNCNDGGKNEQSGSHDEDRDSDESDDDEDSDPPRKRPPGKRRRKTRKSKNAVTSAPHTSPILVIIVAVATTLRRP